MLNIPSSVKALFKQDGVYKNFRVHFQNGEMADLTNDNVVQESVKFTESICSQDVFKFGLTEASVIEFETVGVANMYGMTIECSCEIDCSSLSAADKATIAAGTWDGTWDGVDAVLSVPYGTFRVESCPRDHQAMAHRKVTAYTDSMSDPNPFETAKCALLMFEPKYDPNMQALVYENIYRFSPDALVGNGWTKNNVTLQAWPTTGGGNVLPFYSYSITAKDAGGNDLSCSLKVYGSADYYRVLSQLRGTVTKYRLFSVDYNGEDYDNSADLQAIADALNDAGVDAEQSGYADLLEMARAISLPSFRPMVCYGIGAFNGSVTESSTWAYCYAADGELFYPYRQFYKNDGHGVSWKSNIVGLWTVTSVSLTVGGSTSTLFSKTAASFKYYEPPTEDDTFPLSFESTNEERVQTSEGKRAMFSFSDAFSAEEIAQGFLELTAQFATASRLGGNKLLRIDNASPVSIIPGEYSQMWFDEYTVEPIGTIRYSYTDEAGEEQIVDYQFGSGASVYDMTDNAVLKLMEGADPATIEAMLDANFIPYISAVNFVPIDLQMKGLPYIEAGDALSVTAQDGTICNSFALRHEISGIQALAAQIDSQSGLIIESEAGA